MYSVDCVCRDILLIQQMTVVWSCVSGVFLWILFDGNRSLIDYSNVQMLNDIYREKEQSPVTSYNLHVI